MAEIINLNDATPAAPAGAVNVKWQKGASAGTDPATGLDIYPVSANLAPFTGDAGSGGAPGAVPAPASGDAAAGKFLKADGTFAVPAGGGGSAVESVAGRIGAVTLTAIDVGLGNVTNDAQTEAAVMPNTAPGAGQIPIGNGTSYAPGNLVGIIGITIDASSTGSKGYAPVPYNATVTSWVLLGDATGSAQVTVKKSSYAGFPTTASIVGGAPPALSAQQKNTSSTLTGWTTAITAGDILEFNLDSVATCTKLWLWLQGTRS